MTEKLSKYDVLKNKMNKFSNIAVSFVSSYALALSTKKKNEVIKKLIQKIICDAYILFEIKKDCNNNVNEKYQSYITELNQTTSQLEKLLVLYIICKNKNEQFIYDFIINSISKKNPEEIISSLYSSLDQDERNVVDFLISENYEFNKLPQKYQDVILKNHDKFINANIKPYVSKKESNEIEVLKGMKIYKENVDIDLNINISKKFKNYKKRT